MIESLSLLQRRVLGVLIEKALAQPAYYPMTLNAVVVACNQKSNRDPEMDLAEEAVFDTLEELRQAGLVVRSSTSGGRTDRYRHLANEGFGWDGRQRAVMAELLLRGPQTLSELRTRASRMTPIDSQEALMEVLTALESRNPPQVRALPRQPGQSAIRWTHLLYPPGESPPVIASSEAERPEAARGSAASAPGSAAAIIEQETALREVIDGLRDEISSLREALADLRGRFDELERLLR
ncbi:MAG: DUF480 domain-containing protein [Phycisphaerales bacterium]|nr:DUF480 domain-containing protein [Phycisphaerales bacterium]